MKPMTDWAGLWRELSLAQQKRQRQRAAGTDVWAEHARTYQARAHRRWMTPDASREAIVARLAAMPGASFLDIGAGTGAWAVFLAPRVARITAVEPSPAMIALMREQLAEQAIRNVSIVQAAWPDAEIEPHDYSLCAHAMYSSPDLPAFIHRIEQATRHTCFLIMRAPSPSGVMAEVARHVWGHPHDSPNFQIAYNVLLQMGIRADVQFEEAGLWQAWTSASLEDALNRIKRHLALDTAKHDGFLRNLLAQRLTQQDGQLIWPADMRSALVTWQSGER